MIIEILIPNRENALAILFASNPQLMCRNQPFYSQKYQLRIRIVEI